MKIVVIGLGVQGNKRSKIFNDDLVATVDPLNPVANFVDIHSVPISSYDSALVATPDENKYEIIKFLINNKKNVMVEKPLYFEQLPQYAEIEKLANKNEVIVYTAYNHRFEPNFQKIKHYLNDKRLGEIYSCKLHYGNGTARLVKNSNWRDKKSGVLADLGSHLIDTIEYWFGRNKLNDIKSTLANFENNSPDYAITSFEMNNVRFNLEMNLCNWKNTFFCEIVGELGSVTVSGLCKWGTSKFTHRIRVLPSGIPEEIVFTEPQGDPTWQLEYNHFKNIVYKNFKTDLNKDIWILKNLKEIYDFSKK